MHSRFSKLLDLDRARCARLSLADGIVLVQSMELTDAAIFVGSVDPWCYPEEQTPSVIGVKSYLQSAVDKATNEGKAFVLHPVSPSERAAPVFTATREPAAEPAGAQQAPTPTPDEIRLGGVFETADVTPVASLIPMQRFSAGSIVRVLPDTRPGIRPELAEGLLAATFHSDAGEGFSLVSPMGSTKRRTVPTNSSCTGMSRRIISMRGAWRRSSSRYRFSKKQGGQGNR